MKTEEEYCSDMYWVGYSCGRSDVLDERGMTPDIETGIMPCGCGHPAHIAEHPQDFDMKTIICFNCKMMMGKPYEEDDTDALIKAWNIARGWRYD